MALRNTVRLAVVLLMVGAPHAFADDPFIPASGNADSLSASRVEALLQRLERAEARIRHLEDEKSAAVAFPSPVFDGYDDDPKADVVTKKQFDELLEDVGKKFETQDELNDELQKSIRTSVQSGSSGTKSMKVSGRIHMDALGFPDSDEGINVLETGDPTLTPQDRVGFRRLRFGVGGDVNPNVGYRIEMEFAGGNKTEFRDAYIKMRDVRWFDTIIIGNHKRPYSLDHLNSSRYNVFLERPFVIEGFNQDSRRLGISANGFTDDLAWNWRYGVWQQRLIQDEGFYISDHLQGEIAGRLANTWWYDECSGGRGYGHWALAGTIAHPDGSAGGNRATNEARFTTRPEARSSSKWLDTGTIDGADWYEMIALENVLNIGALQLVGEYQYMFMQRDPGFQDVNFHGGYVYASYFLTGEHMPWNRETGTLGRPKPFENFFLVDTCDGCGGKGLGAWQVAARYSYADFTDADVLGGVGSALTLGLNWYWNPNTRWQFNYIRGQITDRNVVVGPTTYTGGDYEILGTRFMIDF